MSWINLDKAARDSSQRSLWQLRSHLLQPLSYFLTNLRLKSAQCHFHHSLYAILGHVICWLGLLDSLGFCLNYLLALMYQTWSPSSLIVPQQSCHIPLVGFFGAGICSGDSVPVVSFILG